MLTEIEIIKTFVKKKKNDRVLTYILLTHKTIPVSFNSLIVCNNGHIC